MPSKYPTKYGELIEVLADAQNFLVRPENDFGRSSWNDASEALREIDRLIAHLKAGSLPEPIVIKVLFAPTGPIQEVSISSGWGREFLVLANRFDDAMSQAVTLAREISSR